VDYLFDTAFAKHDIKETLGKKYIAKDLLPVIKRLPDEIERDTYIKKLAEGLSVSEESVRETLSKVSAPQNSSSKTIKKEVEYAPVPKKTTQMEENILGLLAQYPHYMDFAANLLAADDFSGEQTGEYFKKMVEYYHKKGDFSEKAFVVSLAKEQRDIFNVFILSAQKEFDDFDDEKKAEEIYFGIKRLKKMSLEAKKKNISSEIARFEKEGDEKGAKEALQSLQALLEEERTVI
jgi:DNA primase